MSSNRVKRECVPLNAADIRVTAASAVRALTGAWSLLATISVKASLGDGRALIDSREIRVRIRQTGRKQLKRAKR